MSAVATDQLAAIAEVRDRHLRAAAGEPEGHVARLCGSSTVFPGVDFLEPRDVTHAAQWLSSDAARYVTGTAFTVDGGFTCK